MVSVSNTAGHEAHRIRRFSLGLMGLAACSILTVDCIIKPEDSNCTPEADCQSCVEQSGCGYCLAGEGRCIAGSSLGPDYRDACLDSEWRFTTCDTPPLALRCAQIDSCTECASTSDCGYCLEVSECRSLDADFGCTLETDPESQTCAEAACHAETTCQGCDEHEDCGWCSTDLACHHVNNSSGCELVLDPTPLECEVFQCRAIEDCRDCIETESCGWCLWERECRHAERADGCDLDFALSQCHAEYCLVAASCEECLELNCDWCELTRWCHDFSHRVIDVEDLCFWEQAVITYDCPPENDCRTHSGCSECISDPQCGYCVVEEEFEVPRGGCIPVDSTGFPYGAYCSVALTQTECDIIGW